MKDISEIVKWQLKDTHEMTSMLHKHWVNSGAIRDPSEQYLVKIDSRAVLAYMPKTNTIMVAFIGRVKGFDHVVKADESGEFEFSDHMDDKAMNHFADIMDLVRKEVITIREKAMTYSPYFFLKINEKEMLKCMDDILMNINKLNAMGSIEYKSSNADGFVEIEIINPLTSSRFFISINQKEKSIQISRNTPSGEKEPLVFACKSYISGIPDYVGFNSADKIDDKKILLKACLFEAQIFNASLVHEIKGLEKIEEMRMQNQHNNEIHR